MDWGLDGVEYDLRACASGEAVLLHDAHLERTTDASGALAECNLVELAQVDAGLWFGRAFRGEPLPILADALGLVGAENGPALRPALHMIELKERGLARGLARLLAERAPLLDVRVASFSRAACLESQDAEMPTMLLATRACADDLAWVEKHGLAAYGVGPGGWRTTVGGRDSGPGAGDSRDAAGSGDHGDHGHHGAAEGGGPGTQAWPCERWAWSVDDPRDLLEACRLPLFGFNTNEPARALAVRALARRCAPGAPYPIEVPPLIIEPAEEPEAAGGRGSGGAAARDTAQGGAAADAWRGSWAPVARISNPFTFPVEIATDFFARHGAFETSGLPARASLAPGESVEVPMRVAGGSTSPGGDPLLAVRYTWHRGPGREAGSLLLDAPLYRLRRTGVDEAARRLTMLREGPTQPPASITLRRSGRDLLLSLENPGGLCEPHLVATLDGHLVRGGAGLRLRLPENFEHLPEGVPFSCGIEGRRSNAADRPTLRRWSGGLSEGLRSGVPGRLLPGSG